jgi:hypothetical protein
MIIKYDARFHTTVASFVTELNPAGVAFAASLENGNSANCVEFGNEKKVVQKHVSNSRFNTLPLLVPRFPLFIFSSFPVPLLLPFCQAEPQHQETTFGIHRTSWRSPDDSRKQQEVSTVVF